MHISIYIAGKITGEDPEKCKLKFAAVESKLKMIGIETVINPLNMGIPITWDWSAAREKCLEVLREKANTLLLLNDWEKSEGAMEECSYAMNHGYRIFTEDDTDEIMILLKNSGVLIDTPQY